MKVQILRLSSAQVKNHQILVIFETTDLLFLLKFYILSTKGANESTNLVKF